MQFFSNQSAFFNEKMEEKKLAKLQTEVWKSSELRSRIPTTASSDEPFNLD